MNQIDIELRYNAKKISKYVWLISADIFALDFEDKSFEEEYKHVGEIDNVVYVPHFKYYQDYIVGESDSHSQYTYEVTEFAVRNLAKLSESPDWLHLGEVRIFEKFQGKQLGYLSMNELVRLFGNHAVLSAEICNQQQEDYVNVYGLKECLTHLSKDNKYYYFDSAFKKSGFLGKIEDIE
jgi:hypothetical protein